MPSGVKERRDPAINYLHGVKVGLVANASTETATDTAIAWTKEDWDSVDLSESKYHDLVTNNTRLTAPRDGKFTLKTSALFAASDTGARSIGYKINGTGSVVVMATTASAAADVVSGFADLELSEGDYIEVIVSQASGGDLNVVAGANTFASLQFNGF